jgi:D-amino-acid dehydrogenase
MRSLFDRHSALYFQFSKLPELTPWLLRFWTYCNARDHKHGVESLALLGRDVFDLVEEMQRDGVEFELHRQGMLVAAREPETAKEELSKLQPMRDYGYELPDDILSDAELHEYEPALADGVTAGFPVSEHWHVRPDSYTAGIADALRRMDAEIVEGAEVVDFGLNGSRVTSVRTAVGDYSADAFMLAAGAWTTPLAKMIGVRVPMQAGKGYSFFVKPSVIPRHSILLADVHVGCTPLGDDMRIGGRWSSAASTPGSTSAASTTSSPGRAPRFSRGRARRSNRLGPACARSRPTGCRCSTGPPSTTPTSQPATRCRA